MDEKPSHTVMQSAGAAKANMQERKKFERMVPPEMGIARSGVDATRRGVGLSIGWRPIAVGDWLQPCFNRIIFSGHDEQTKKTAPACSK